MIRAFASPSLVRRSLLMLVGSLTIVAVLLGSGGAWLIHGLVERTNDRLLGASVHAIAETLAVEDGELTLDLPPSALGMLENTERDNIYYSVWRDGDLVTGYPDLDHATPKTLPLEQPSFRYATYRGSRIRIAAEARRLPRIPGNVVVQVAETLEAREALTRGMLGWLTGLEGAFVVIVALLVWPAVRWGLNPVTRLQAQLAARQGADFHELPLEEVPIELKGLVGGFNILLRRLEASTETVRRFTADASHQMRTPLTILSTHLAVLERETLAGEHRKASMADIRLAAARLESLLTGLIALARAEESKPAPESAVVDLHEVARDVAIELAPAASCRRINLELDAPATPPLVSGDRVLVRELITNLLDNAIRYSPARGRVLLKVRDTPFAAVEISDEGPGIPSEHRDQVFERFFRLPRDQKQTGSGLGLSIVKALADRLGARISIVDPDWGHGARFCVRFCDAKARAVDHDLPRPSASRAVG